MLRWGLSILDFRHHAIDERVGHPSGVYRAECGHLLLTVTVLREAAVEHLCTSHGGTPGAVYACACGSDDCPKCIRGSALPAPLDPDQVCPKCRNVTKATR